MRFTLSSTILSDKLGVLSRVINSKAPQPILADFLFNVHDNQLNITASDGDNIMLSAIDVQDEDGDGSFCITCGNILEVIKNFPDMPLTFDINWDNWTASVDYPNGHFSMPINNPGEYPNFDMPGDTATTISIASQMLFDNISRTLFAADQGDARPILAGLLFDIKDDRLCIVATDGQKLVRSAILGAGGQPKQLILPRKPATLLKSCLSREGDDVTIRFDENKAEIVFDDATLVCRLTAGRYPAYESVIPSDNPLEVTIDRLSLISALRRVQPFANKATGLFRMHVETGLMQLDAQNQDFNKLASEKLSCDYNDQPINIGFSCNTIIDLLSNLESDNVIIRLADPSRAGLLLPMDQPQGQDVLMLMMPLLVGEY